MSLSLNAFVRSDTPTPLVSRPATRDRRKSTPLNAHTRGQLPAAPPDKAAKVSWRTSVRHSSLADTTTLAEPTATARVTAAPMYCDSVSASANRHATPPLDATRHANPSLRLPPARAHRLRRTQPPCARTRTHARPARARQVACGRSFTVFIAAPIAPMAESEAAMLIQSFFRYRQLERERTRRRSHDRAAQLITSRAASFVARRALEGVRVDLSERRREVAASPIQASMRRQSVRLQRPLQEAAAKPAPPPARGSGATRKECTGSGGAKPPPEPGPEQPAPKPPVRRTGGGFAGSASQAGGAPQRTPRQPDGPRPAGASGRRDSRRVSTSTLIAGGEPERRSGAAV